ncbi:MAG: CBS domain-containing protein [Candidatus Bathyarchaeia archaeon]|jgi:CBS domain-containing protein|nr:CBS domain-containing protein [Candidatus Bathyarchaeota archaeon A05DMB-4]MDH7595012.1 CBS domain-containing protein [Candidatus Bathyarchaeota archaeon]
MAELGIRPRMLVKDAMTSPVLTVDENTTVDKVAQLMDKHGFGCIIVTGKDGKAIGVITEKDMVSRVLAKNVLPSKLKAKKVMSTPLITVNPDLTLSEAARTMSRLNIRRLGVMYKGNLVGIISSRDILNVTPELIETIQEKARLENAKATEEEAEATPLAGYCDRCGAWSDTLKEIEGQFICEDCRAEIKGE